MVKCGPLGAGHDGNRTGQGMVSLPRFLGREPVRTLAETVSSDRGASGRVNLLTVASILH